MFFSCTNCGNPNNQKTWNEEILSLTFWANFAKMTLTNPCVFSVVTFKRANTYNMGTSFWPRIASLDLAHVRWVEAKNVRAGAHRIDWVLLFLCHTEEQGFFVCRTFLPAIAYHLYPSFPPGVSEKACRTFVSNLFLLHGTQDFHLLFRVFFLTFFNRLPDFPPL